MIGKLALPEVRELLAIGDTNTLRDVLSQWFPADLAELLYGLSDDAQALLVRALEGGVAAQVFEHLDLSTQERLLDAIPEAESASLLERMAPDDRTALLEELPPHRARALLERLSPGERAVAETLLTFSPESVGRLMTPDFVAVKRDWTIKHVLDHVRSHGRDSETLNVIYVVDDEHRLVADLRIRFILLAPLHQHVRDLAGGPFVALKATDDKESAVEVFRKYDRTALPVLDGAECCSASSRSTT